MAKLVEDKRELRYTELLASRHLGGAEIRQPRTRRTILITMWRKSVPIPGLTISFPGRALVAVVGRPMSQMEGCLESMIGEDDIAIAGEMNAIEIKTAATYVRMNTLPLARNCCRKNSAIADRALRQCTRFKLLFWRDRRPVQSSLVHRSSVTFQ